MGWGFLGDVVDAATDVVEDVADKVTDTVDEVVEKAGDAVDAAVDKATDLADAVTDKVGGFGSGVFGAIVDKAGDLGQSVLDKAADAGNGFLNAIDETVLDTVDYVTHGVVNVDYENGEVSANAGIPGIASAGFKAGEDGFAVEADSLLASGGISYDSDEGFAASGTAGIDFGPLPYANGHIEVSPNGDISIGGEVQGTLPTPWGVLSGEAEGGFVRTDEGWGAYVQADGSLLLPSGTTLAGGGGVRYQEDAEGNSVFGANVHGSISEPGVGTIGGSAGYTRIEEDGVVVEQITAEGHASGFGMSAEAGVEHVEITTDQGSVSHTETHADIDGFDAESIAQLGEALLGEDAGGAIGTVAGQAGAVLDAAQGAMGGMVDVLGNAPAAVEGGLEDVMTMSGDLLDGNVQQDLHVIQETVATVDEFTGGAAAPAAPEPQFETPEPAPSDFDTALDTVEETADSVNAMWDGVGDS